MSAASASSSDLEVRVSEWYDGLYALAIVHPERAAHAVVLTEPELEAVGAAITAQLGLIRGLRGRPRAGFALRMRTLFLGMEREVTTSVRSLRSFGDLREECGYLRALDDLQVDMLTEALTRDAAKPQVLRFRKPPVFMGWLP